MRDRTTPGVMITGITAAGILAFAAGCTTTPPATSTAPTAAPASQPAPGGTPVTQTVREGQPFTLTGLENSAPQTASSRACPGRSRA
jgi:hypothetical protein